MTTSYNYSLKMLEVCRVTPFTNSAIRLAELSLPLTYFDMFWVKLFPLERIFFYQLGQHESTHTFFNSVLLPKLKHSLSLTLTHFLPIAGHIIWPVGTEKPSFLYTPSDGVSLIVSESNSDFNRLSQNEMQEAIALHPYVPELPVSDSKAAIIAFQITFFPNQGFSIGMRFQHAMFDGKSVAMFMKSWAHICKVNSDMTTLLPLELTPILDRTVVDEPQGLGMFYLKNRFPGSDSNPKSLKHPRVIRDMENIVRANFELSRQDITNLQRNIVSQQNGKEEEDSKSMHLSSFVLSYAYIIVTLVKSKHLVRKGKVGFKVLAECRSRLNPPLPTNYFGTCVLGSFTLVDTETILDKNGVASVANELSEMIKGLETRVKNMCVEREIEQALKLKNIEEVADVVIGVAGSPRFDIYGTDFGWGKPKKTQAVSIDKNVTITISMAESRDSNGGLEVGLALKKSEMKMFTFLFANGLK
ncbi:malonyl-CoA:anthocyanidin 5-O-glucoside-6''-O-malonyltransferase-like [Euphorbia lathyris]|uniref:malonyl-CoA:anthocyanidin 5-O-glucoside-6''-O-malonyltransferase-like n=1 Tax=Euphorbia lathyris TaxID=212925 RepID=UPI003313F324